MTRSPDRERLWATADAAQHERLVAAEPLPHPVTGREEVLPELDRDRHGLGELVLLGLDPQEAEAARQNERVDAAEPRALEGAHRTGGVRAASGGAQHADALMEVRLRVRVAGTQRQEAVVRPG